MTTSPAATVGATGCQDSGGTRLRHSGPYPLAHDSGFVSGRPHRRHAGGTGSPGGTRTSGVAGSTSGDWHASSKSAVRPMSIMLDSSTTTNRNGSGLSRLWANRQPPESPPATPSNRECTVVARIGSPRAARDSVARTAALPVGAQTATASRPVVVNNGAEQPCERMSLSGAGPASKAPDRAGCGPRQL
jgi:hypothetical protein